MPKNELQGLYIMCKEIAQLINKNPDSFRHVVRQNIKLIISKIPPEEILEIFEKEGDSDEDI